VQAAALTVAEFAGLWSAYQAAGNAYEAVAGERPDGLAVELSKLPGSPENEPERARPPLPERTLEPALFAKRCVLPPPRRTRVGQRAGAAARDAGQADRRTEVHEGVCALGPEPAARALLHATDVCVHGEHGSVEGEARERVRRVAADAGKLRWIRRPARAGDPLRCPMEADGTAVVAEALPRADDVREQRRGERLCGRPALEPREVARDDALYLRLLEHHLGDEDRVRIARPPPGQITPVLRVPGE